MSPNGPQQGADPEASPLAEEKLMLSSAFTDSSGFHMTDESVSPFSKGLYVIRGKDSAKEKKSSAVL